MDTSSDDAASKIESDEGSKESENTDKSSTSSIKGGDKEESDATQQASPAFPVGQRAVPRPKLEKQPDIVYENGTHTAPFAEQKGHTGFLTFARKPLSHWCTDDTCFSCLRLRICAVRLNETLFKICACRWSVFFYPYINIAVFVCWVLALHRNGVVLSIRKYSLQ